MSQKEIERKYLPFEVKEVDVENSEFTGFAAAMGNEDLGRDIIAPGAFDKTINERVAAGKVKFLDNHNGMTTRNVWGTVMEAEEVEFEGEGENAPSHKLLTRFSVSEADPDAQVALKKIKERHLDQLSIGFQAIKEEFEIDEDSNFESPRMAWVFGEGTRTIKELKLWEVSLVIWGMNPEATIIQNSLKTLERFAVRANQKGIQIPEASVKEAILALSFLLDTKEQPDETRQAVAKALEEVSEAVDSVCAIAQKNRFDPIQDLLEEFKESREDDSWKENEFGLWVTQKAFDDEDEDDCGCGEKEENPEDEMEEKEDNEEIEIKEDSVEVETEEKEDELTVEGKPSIDEEVIEAIGELKGSIDSLRKAMVSADSPDNSKDEDPDAEISEDEEVKEDHTEETEDKEDGEAAESADDDGRSEHFPGQDELAAELDYLEVLLMDT